LTEEFNLEAVNVMPVEKLEKLPVAE